MAGASEYLLCCEYDNSSAIYKILFYHRPEFYDASSVIGGFTVKQIGVLAIKQVETALQIASKAENVLSVQKFRTFPLSRNTLRRYSVENFNSIHGDPEAPKHLPNTVRGPLFI
jgi:hypothetical protein